MKKITILIFIILTSIKVFACCAEHNYRLFPIGEFDEKVIFIEFDFFRQCKNVKGTPGIGKENEYWIKGKINLVTFENDSCILIENIDTIKIKECVCTYKNQYEKSEYEFLLKKYYKKAFLTAQEKIGFTKAQPKEIIFNDTVNTSIIDTGTSFFVTYKDLFKIDISAESIISCYPSNIIEVRKYDTENFTIIVIRLSCQKIEKIAIQRIKKRFEQIETAFWKEKASWHGINKDYVTIKNKNH